MTDRRRVLMLTHRVPYPPDRGDRIRAYNFLKRLGRHFDVWLACTSDEPVTTEQRDELRRLTRDYEIQPIASLSGKLRGLGSLVLGGAVTTAYFYRRGLARKIAAWHRTQRFHTVLTFCTGMIHYAREVVRVDEELGGNLRHVIDLVDVDSEKWREYSEKARPPHRWIYGAEARRLRDIEAGKADRFDAIAVASDFEAETYHRSVGSHPGLITVRQAVDLDYFQPFPDAGGATIVFVGVLDYQPNVQGIRWFAESVFPQLGEDARLKIVGQRPSAEVQALAGPRIEVVGPVPDVRDYLREATVVIAPLDIARGVQTKVLEGMASGRVVVCTPAAARGIVAEPGRHFLVEETAEDWARSLRQLLDDAEMRRRIAAAAREHVEAEYGWERCLEPLVPVVLG